MDDLVICLTLFSEEKTEKATPKRRKEAREKGQVAKSREVVSAVLLLLMFWCIKILSGYIYDRLTNIISRFLTVFTDVDSLYQSSNLRNMFMQCIWSFFLIVLPIMAVALLASVVANYLQVGFLFSTKPLMPNFNKLNPIQGLKRLFSKNSLIELLKASIKMLLIGYFIYDFLRDNYMMIANFMNMELNTSMAFIGNAIITIGLRSSIMLLVLSVFDYGYQLWEFEKNLKMTKQEIKEEYKQTEGNPQVKSKIKEKQRQLSLRRMMAEVPKADVIITNPTHYAVAIKYDSNISDAPVVTAKGKDLIAYRIKEKAKESNVPVIENKPLAQALFKTTDIGQQIPVEMYQAVAEILAFVYSLKNK
ncbi:flagellar biosynthesis protein FlhB [Lutispora thermophila]|uniref:flagellar biosynthesis protein FlhB n=1 Tax=Lutispora thermophila TaxID=288966 RepID=UPI000A050E52|nr:flagellar biosynthesis protein FlhB [Lutispora thermophila]